MLMDIDVWDTPGSRKVASFKDLNEVVNNCDVSFLSYIETSCSTSCC